jgi:hypothetical protein
MRILNVETDHLICSDLLMRSVLNVSGVANKPSFIFIFSGFSMLKSYIFRSLMSTTLDSICAKCCPIQFLAPLEKGVNKNGCGSVLFSFNQCYGIN